MMDVQAATAARASGTRPHLARVAGTQVEYLLSGDGPEDVAAGVRDVLGSLP